MEDAIVGMFAIFAIFIFCPAMIVYFLTKRREHAATATGNPSMNADLLRVAEKLEKRVQSLETILDAEVPGWRKNLDRGDH